MLMVVTIIEDFFHGIHFLQPRLHLLLNHRIEKARCFLFHGTTLHNETVYLHHFGDRRRYRGPRNFLRCDKKHRSTAIVQADDEMPGGVKTTCDERNPATADIP